ATRSALGQEEPFPARNLIGREGRIGRSVAVIRYQQVKAARRASQVYSVHLCHWIASTGCGTVRDDAVDFCEIICRKHNVRGAHILLEVLARFRARDRYDEGTRTRALGHWPSDGELGERGALPACDDLKRPPQSEGVPEIG